MRELLTAFLVRFANTYTTDDASLPERVRHAWLPVSATIGQVVRATTSDGRTVTGRAVGIDGFGSLQLSTDDGELRVGFGEIEHLRPSDVRRLPCLAARGSVRPCHSRSDS